MGLRDSEGQSRCMAFISYSNENAFFAALDYNGTDYGGKRLTVKRAEDKGGQGPTLGPKPSGCNSIVLRKLSPDVSEDDLHSLFRDCGGGPKKVGLLKHPSGVS